MTKEQSLMSYIVSMITNKHLFSLTYILLALISIFWFSCKDVVNEIPQVENKLEVNRQYRPFIHHFSSTGCGPCGRFGVPVLNKVADEMGDSIFGFITHFKYNDPFITESSQAIEKGILSEWYSPQIWVENENITFDLLRLDVNTASELAKSILREKTTNNAEAYIGMQTTLKANSRTDVELVVQNATDSTITFFVEVYGMEDGLVASQAGAPNNLATHFRVNRGGHYGEMGKEIKLEPGAEFRDTFEYIPCWTCEPNAVYFNAIVWKQNASGKYVYVNGLEVK